MSNARIVELLNRVVPASERGRPDWDDVLARADVLVVPQPGASGGRRHQKLPAIVRTPVRRPSVRALALGSLISFAALIGVVQVVRAHGTEPPAAASRERTPADTIDALPAHVRAGAERAGLQLDTSRRIAPNLYLVRRSGGELCMVSTANGMAMGCGPEATFFGSEAVVYGIDERGSSDAPRQLTIYGVARPDVKVVRLVFPSAEVLAAISSDGGFSVTTTREMLEHGRPTHLIAQDANGRTIQSISLPQS